ncbi:ras-domain-containing protein [Daedalea quercina L-15889]|uniref:Ras-domain-containing protein n=1 Tax=Daedalea quercina L-15889 TaxID=1314783 RepID=A0A165S6T2_9APHY|nr:ras-domain-containing protein [Daedalea quercina L-15889]
MAYARNPYSKSRYDQGIDAKIVIMGNTGVGKTSLLHRYTQNKFDPKNTTSTTGAFFVTKKVYVDGIKVRLQLWDTAGQERFRSMAPMYYRGANAALLLYDITNASSFDDVRGWLEELKKNCDPDLIIYIVGAKADLTHKRQITSDLARLSLHTWFPPPRPPSPPPPPPPSTFSYIRPRFTSFPSMRSSPAVPQAKPPLSPPPELEETNPRASAMKRSHTTAVTRPRAKSGSLLSFPTAGPNMDGAIRSAAPTHFGFRTAGWSQVADGSSSGMDEEEEETDDASEQEWGLNKGMELFEVSAKDDTGIQQLFDSLMGAIIARKDRIEEENELKKRDSVYLASPTTPMWAAQADAEEAREKAQQTAGTSWNCCST